MFRVYYNPKREKFEYRKGSGDASMNLAIRQLRLKTIRFVVSEDKWFDIVLSNENVSSTILMKPQFLPRRGGLLFFFLTSYDKDAYFEIDGKTYPAVIEIPKKIYNSWAYDIEEIMKELDIEFHPPIC